MVLTEEVQQAKYLPATVEDATWQTEANVYTIVDARRKPTPDGANKANFGEKVYRTQGTTAGEKTGLNAVIKVMSGDQVAVMAESYYTPPTGPIENNKFLVVEDLLSAFTGSGLV